MTKKRRYITLLFCACVLCLVAAMIIMFVPTSKKVNADASKDQALQSALDGVTFSVNDGAQVSVQSPYVLRFNFTVTDSHANTLAALSTALEAKKEDYILLAQSGKKTGVYMLIFKEDELPTLNSNLSGVELDWKYKDDPEEEGYAFGNDILLDTADNMHLDINGVDYHPEYVFDFSSFENIETRQHLVSINVGKENNNTNYVPILVLYAGYYTSGPLCSWMHAYHATKLVYNSNAVRSVATVSSRALDDEDYIDYYDESELNVLRQNVGGGQPAQKLEETTTISQLKGSYPLNFEMLAGATFDNSNKSITWECRFNAVSFDTWKQSMDKMTLWWFVMEFDRYANTGDTVDDFNWNLSNAVRTWPEHRYELTGAYYTSTVTYVPDEGKQDTYYIAIPFIKVVGYKNAAGSGMVPFEDVASGTYVTCEAKDNARSVSYYIAPTGPFYYTFTYLEELENKPFAEKKTKTVMLEESIDFNTFTEMSQFADLLELDMHNGNITCLMSKVNWWAINQLSASTYNISAMYTLIPLTFTNDKKEIKSQELGLIPFTNIDAKNLYAQQITSLKDKEGKPYFETLYDVEPGNLYGYFYTYSYESEYEDPNWQLNKDSYNGSIVYFTELADVQYKIGYMEVAAIGGITGAVTGAIIGTIAGGVGGFFVGAAVGGISGAVLSGGAASLFGCEQDSKSIYYNIEYGFLDCTTMHPGNEYETEKDPELQEWEKIVLALAIIIEVIALAGVAPKFKVFGVLGMIIFSAAVIAGFVWIDIALYNFLLTGI